MWHVDTTVIRLLDGTRAYLHAVIDNFSRRILAWRVVEALLNRRGRPVHCSHAHQANASRQNLAIRFTPVLRQVLLQRSLARRVSPVSHDDRELDLVLSKMMRR